MYILPLLIFLAVSFALAGLYLWFAPTRAERRLREAAPATDGAHWTETVVRISGPFARLSMPTGDWERSPLRLRFIHAGLRQPNARPVYFAAKTVLPLAGAVAAYLVARSTGSGGLTLYFHVLLGALVGCYLPNLVLHMLVRRRQRAIFDHFPDAADLLLICVEAGLGMDAALTKVADELRRECVPLAQELHLTNLEIRAGAARQTALHHLALRTGVDELRTFATMLTQSDKFGTAVADSLRVFSEDLRHRRAMRAEELAATVPTKMLFPLVLFIFPSIIMVVMGPAVIRVVRMILPMLNGAQ